jgi:hypothetical protein
MSDITVEVSGAAAPSRNAIVGIMLGWTTGIALRLVMVLVVIALVRSPPSALH